MVDMSFFRFIVWALLCFCIFVVAQLPSSMKVSSPSLMISFMAHCYLLQVQIDVDKFMESFTIDSNSDRTSAGAWRYAPGQSAGDRDLAICKVPSVPLDEEQQDPRHGPLRRWSEHVERSLEFLPSAICTAQILQGKVTVNGSSKT